MYCRHIRHAGGLIGRILTGYMEVPAGSPQDSEQALFDEDSDICINIILIRMFLQDQFIHDNLNRNLALALQFAVNGTVDDILLHQIEDFRICFKREDLHILSAAVADGSSHLGLQNVRERLSRISGGELIITSKTGEGSDLTITLPKSRQGGLGGINPDAF